MRNQFVFFISAAFVLSCNDVQKPIKPEVASISESVYASGIIKSKNQYEAFSPVSGIVESIFVSEGDTVVKGSALLSISSDVQRLNQESAMLSANFAKLDFNQDKLKDARSTIEVSRVRMKHDSLMFLRQSNLWRQQIGSKVEFEQKELAYQNSKAAYLSATMKFNDLKKLLEYNASQAQRNLSVTKRVAKDYLLKSQINGTVYSITKEVGEMVSQQAPLAVIGDKKQFILEMQVDEYDILKVRNGLPVHVSLDSYKDHTFKAKVTRINPIMDKRSRTFLVEAEFVEPPGVLYPNISFEANIVVNTKKDALLIPRIYVVDDSAVFKSNGDKVRVRTGLRDYKKIEILSGVTANDELILP